MAKKIKTITPQMVRESELLGYKELIAPSIATFKGHSTYYVIGNTYRSVWAVRSYPNTVKHDSDNLAMLREIGEADGVTLKIYVRELPQHEHTQIMESAQRRNKKNTGDYKITAATEAAQNLQDISDLIVRSARTKEPFAYCAVYIEIIQQSLESLKAKQAEISSMLNRHKILVDRLHMQQMSGFLCVMPTGKNVLSKQFERAMPISSVANLFPLSYSGKTDPKGFYIGKDENGSNIIADFDFRTQDKTNGHVIILGNSGEGKSYLLKLLIINAVMAGKKCYILDPDDEYRELVQNLGGTYINMMSTDYIINPLEPRKWTLQNTDDEPIDENTPTAFTKQGILNQHVAYLRDFFKVFKDFDEGILDVLEIMLMETYKRKGITDASDFSRLNSNDYPILSELYDVIETAISFYDEEFAEAAEAGHPIMYSKDKLQDLGLGLRSICVGVNSQYFSGHTNIPNADFIDFSVKDALTTNENLKNAMFLNIFSFMSNKFLSEGECVLVADELHEFVKNKLAINYICSFMKRGRKKESNVFLGSQNIEDLMATEVIAYTKPLLMIPSHSFLFHPGANCNPEEYQKNINVQPYEFRLIASPNQGHCLYKCGDERYHLHVIAPPHKRRLFGKGGGRGAAA